MITRVKRQKFEDQVLKSELPVFVCFVTSWCGSCFALRLVMKSLVKRYRNKMRFVEVDAEETPEIVEKYHLRALPTMLIFKDGKPVKKLLGFRHKRELIVFLDKVVAGN